MDKLSLNLYYASMVVYMVGGIPLILYTLIIRPIAQLYHEPISTMVSPVFGNYGIFLRNLFIISVVAVTISLVLYLVSVYRTKHGNRKISTFTVIFPLILYVFGYVLLGVSGT